MRRTATAIPADTTGTATNLGTRLAYGSSAFAENLAINSINQLAFAVFNIALLVSPTLVGLALSLPRLLDFFIDPWIGSWSDRLRSRWGRRRPFMAVGAALSGVVAAGLWWFPEGRSTSFYFWWLTAGSVAMAVAYSIFVIPYGALGLELATGFHERTRLMGTRSMFHKASGVINQWLLKGVQMAGAGHLVAGGRICAPFIGATIAMLGLFTAWRVPERGGVAVTRPPARRVSMAQSWRITMGRPDFRRLCLAQILIYASVLVIDNTGFYLNVFLVHSGSMAEGAWMKGWYGTAFQGGGMLAIPLIVAVSRRVGKKSTFLFCTLTIVLGGVAKWFCFVPGAGWWLLLPSALMAPGLAAVMVLAPSMTADICDLDHAESGARREGMYNAVLGWSLKLAISGSIFLAGWVLSLTGWMTELREAQAPETFLAMRIIFAGGTILFAGLAAWVMAGYRVSQHDVATAQAAMVEEELCV